MIDQLFVSKFSPKKLSAFVLPQRIKDMFKDEDDPLRQSMIFYGLQGCGKSSLAKYLGKKYVFLYINASTNGRIEDLRDIVTEFCDSSPLLFDEGVNSDRKVVLFDEINGASAQFFEGLKGFMEEYSSVIFLATTNHFHKIPDPIKSRMVSVDFTPQTKEEEEQVMKGYKSRIGKILEGCGIECAEEGFEMLMKKYYPDFRSTLNFLQSVYNGSKIVDKNSISSYGDRFSEIYDMILDKSANPVDIHKLLGGDYSSIASEIIESLDTDFIEYMTTKLGSSMTSAIPTICIVVCDHLYKLQMSVDPMIVLKSCVFTLNNYYKSLK